METWTISLEVSIREIDIGFTAESNHPVTAAEYFNIVEPTRIDTSLVNHIGVDRKN